MDIKNLLEEWSGFLQKSQLIFFHAPPRSRKTLFFNDSLLNLSDTRVRTFPFITRRPTLTELVRCFKELTTVQVREIESLDSVDVNTSSRESNSKKIDEPDDDMKKLIDLCRRGKTEILRATLNNSPHFVGRLSERLNESYGTSLLHIAASNSHSTTVTLLLSLGADPTLRQLLGLQQSPFEIAPDRETKDAFRRSFGLEPDKWDWSGAGGIPSPLTKEMEEKQKEREKERKRKAKERQKNDKEVVGAVIQAAVAEDMSGLSNSNISRTSSAKSNKSNGVLGKLGKSERQSMGMTPERRALLDREKRYV